MVRFGNIPLLRTRKNSRSQGETEAAFNSALESKNNVQLKRIVVGLKRTISGKRYGGKSRSSSSTGRTPLSFIAKSAIAVIILWTSRLLLFGRNSSTSRISEARFKSLEPPKDLMVHGKLVTAYAKVPAEYNRTFQLGGIRGNIRMGDAFRKIGWTEVQSMETAQVVYRGKIVNGEAGKLKPWQRYSRVPWTTSWEGKDKFLIGFRNYMKHTQQQPSKNNNKGVIVPTMPSILERIFNQQNKQQQREEPSTLIQDELYFLPETYVLRDEDDKNQFHKRLYEKNGIDLPWVLKKTNLNNGHGIEILGSNSKALETSIQRVEDDTTRMNYIVQSYVCNELVWFGGQKFDLRFFWLVLSVDPPIVLFHDGYARVGINKYNESDFSETGPHLTNHNFRDDTLDGSSDRLWTLVREHYSNNHEYLSNRLRISYDNNTLIEDIDPVAHVRNQIKEALGVFSFAFLTGETKTFANSKIKVGPDNLFGLYGCDFIIDNDLDVYFVEAQASPGIPSQTLWKKKVFNDVFTPIPLLVEEIITKQQNDAKGNLLPLENLGSYELVRAGDWQFKYEGYQRSKEKKGCTTSTDNSAVKTDNDKQKDLS